MTKDLRGKVDPLPEVKPYEPVPYTADELVDPFRPEPRSRSPQTAPGHGGGRRRAARPEPAEGAARGVPAGVDADGRHARRRTRDITRW